METHTLAIIEDNRLIIGCYNVHISNYNDLNSPRNRICGLSMN